MLASFFNAFVVAYLQRPLQYREEILKDIHGQGNEEDLLYHREVDYIRRLIHSEITPELIRNVLMIVTCNIDLCFFDSFGSYPS